jgi:hypothetical protein
VPEFGAIFDYQLSTMVFSYATAGFMAVFAMTAIWAAARSDDRAVGKPQAA